ncbi:MAG: hypothetical protein RLZZ631_1850 [Cyanobacteriota bacterium]|jgi:hypothetical protein
MTSTSHQHHLGLGGFTLGLLLTLLPCTPAGRAQGVDQTLDRIEQLQQLAPARQRALNLARNTAIQLNGGLSRYMPAACMFSTGGSGGSCLIQTDSAGFLFRFNGGAPGWQQLGTPATTTTEIRISPDGRSVVELLYNGAPAEAPGA